MLSSKAAVTYEVDNFNCSRYKLSEISPKIGNAISNNLNLKLYKSLKWVLRSGAALAGNFKQLPIPSISMTDKEIYEYFNLTQEEINYIESTIK
jgi:hypothetical protein